MAKAPRIHDPQVQAASLARAFVLNIPGIGNVYLMPVQGEPTADDSIGFPTLFIRHDPANSATFLYSDFDGSGDSITPLGSTSLPAATDITIAAGVATLTGNVHTLRGAGAAADDLDTISGMANSEFAFLLCGAEVITIRDAAVGAGNIAVNGDESLVLATGDLVMAVRSGAVVRVTALSMAAGIPEGSLAPIPDAGSLFTATTLALMLQELRTTMLSVAVADSVAVAGELTLVQEYQTARGEAAAADDVDTITGLADSGTAVLLCGAEAVTYRDFAVGGGNISTPRNSSIVTATGDLVLAKRIGAVVYIAPLMIQAGIPGALLGPAATADLLVLLATDQIDNSVLIQAIVNGAFQADAATRALFAARCITVDKLTGTAAVANVPVAPDAILTGIGTFAMAPVGAGAWDMDTLAGLNDGEWAWLTISDATRPCTIRDFSVGAGNIFTRRQTSIVLAALTDMALVIRDGASYKVMSVVSLAGQASGLDGAETIGQLVPITMYGAWAVDGDAAHTNGGGLVGQPAVLIPAGAAYCKVYDVGTTTWSDVSLSSALAGWTANYQLTADAANEEVGDLFAFGFDVPAPEFALDLSALATWDGDGMKWTYSDGAGSRADLGVAGAAGEGYDNMDTTAQDGLRSMQQIGALTFEPPADYVADTIDGQLAYWITGEIVGLNVTQTPILNSVQHDAVVGEEPWRLPHGGTINALVVNDAAATLHTARDVVFILWDSITGEHRKFTFAQDLRRERIACATPWALTAAARLFLYVIQEDGTNEPTVETVECWLDISTTDHSHLI